MSSLADDFDLTKPAGNPLGKQLCQPSSMCAWANNKCGCNITDKANYLYDVCHEKNPAGDEAICTWSTKDLDCPAKGCPALQISLPSGFTPDDAADYHRPKAGLFSFDSNYDWNVSFNKEDASLAGVQCYYTSDPASCLPPPSK
jgi:hypothetical protein